jgi:hypothetical protein
MPHAYRPGMHYPVAAINQTALHRGSYWFTVTVMVRLSPLLIGRPFIEATPWTTGPSSRR